MADTTSTTPSVTLYDLEDHVRELHGLTIALHCAIEGAARTAWSDEEARHALSTLAGNAAQQARELEKLWEQAYPAQRKPSHRQQLAEWAERQGRPNVL